MTKTIANELKEVQELIQETQRLQEKYPHNKKGLEIGLQSLRELEKEMTQALISEKAREIKTDNRFIYTTKKNGTLIIIDKQDNGSQYSDNRIGHDFPPNMIKQAFELILYYTQKNMYFNQKTINYVGNPLT